MNLVSIEFVTVHCWTNLGCLVILYWLALPSFIALSLLYIFFKLFCKKHLPTDWQKRKRHRAIIILIFIVLLTWGSISMRVHIRPWYLGYLIKQAWNIHYLLFEPFSIHSFSKRFNLCVCFHVNIFWNFLQTQKPILLVINSSSPLAKGIQKVFQPFFRGFP